MDVLHKVLKVFDHHRYLFAAVLVAVCAGGWIVGCQPTTASLLDPARQVTAPEIAREVAVLQGELDKQASRIAVESNLYDSEVATAQAKIDSAAADIEQQVQFRRYIIETAGGLGVAFAEGSLNPASAIGTIVQLLLAGVVAGGTVDTIRKNRVIKRLKNGTAPGVVASVPGP